jgi:hypothetical protein
MKAVKSSVREGRPAQADGAPGVRLEVCRADIHVIFTTPQATRAALRAADALMPSGEGRIHFLVPQVVPLGFEIDRPPVAVRFGEHRAAAMARECCRNAAVQVQIVLCGNREQCIERTLRPNSLVMIGSSKQTWLTAERKLARQLRRGGYRVIRVLEP